jgi:hypothetical protein
MSHWSIQNTLQHGNTRSLVAYMNDQDLRAVCPGNAKLDFATAGVDEGITCDLRHRRGYARLLLSVKMQQACHLPSALP